MSESDMDIELKVLAFIHLCIYSFIYLICIFEYYIYSVQYGHSVMSNSLGSHGLQHARLPCPSLTPWACSNSCPLNRDAIQPSHPLSPPCPPAFNLSQHQGLFQWVSSSHQVAKVLELQHSPCHEYSGLISFRMDWYDLLTVQGTLKSLFQHHSSKVSILPCSDFIVQLSHPYMTTGRKAEWWRIDTFELWCWKRLLRLSWTARRSNQSILKEISPECLLEGLMLKLKLQYFGHLMRRTDSLEKVLMLGKIKGRRRRGQQKIWWLDGITDSMDTPGVGDGQGGLECCSPWGRKESDTTEWLNWTELRKGYIWGMVMVQNGWSSGWT